MELRKRLTALRTERGLSQEELAREVEVTRQTVSKWERGLIAPSTVNLIALGRLYGVSLDELVNGEPPAGEHEEKEAEKPEEVERPEEAPTRKKHLPLKIMGAAAAAAFILLVSAASVITIVSAVAKEKEPEEPEDNIIWTDDMVTEDIDLSQVIDLSDGTEIIHLPDGTTTIFFDVTLEP